MADTIRHLEVCAGIGGFSLGLRLADPRVRTVGFVEREAFPAAVLLARMEDETLERAPVWCGQLQDLDGSELRGEVDLITAGFPCQPWSSAGKRRGTEDERWIWPDIAQLIADVAPRCVFLENVSLDAFRQPFGDLRDMGFELPPPVEIAAADVGAPHIRKRFFAVGLADRNGRGLQGIPESWLRQPEGGHDAHRCGSTVVSQQQSFPPFFSDTAGWARWRFVSDAEPALCRGADGLSNRLVGPMRRDRLRALGNAVLPQCVAAAWTHFMGN